MSLVSQFVARTCFHWASRHPGWPQAEALSSIAFCGPRYLVAADFVSVPARRVLLAFIKLITAFLAVNYLIDKKLEIG